MQAYLLIYIYDFMHLYIIEVELEGIYVEEVIVEF